MPPPSPSSWRIGDLAAAVGLTVRTLHHYEQLGLLAPSRSDGNHRVYDAEDVARLHRIRALRELGVPLAAIGDALEGRSLPALLAARLAHLDGEIARLTDLRARLVALTAATTAGPEELVATIEAMSRLSAHAARRRASGSSDAGAWWQALGERLRACKDAGRPPDSPEVQAVAREAHIAIAAFAVGDADVIAALAHIRAHAPPAALAGWDPPLFRYLDDALSTLESTC